MDNPFTHYNCEIAVNGLCLISLKQPSPDRGRGGVPLSAGEVEVLMVDACEAGECHPEHRPLFNYFGQDARLRKGDPISPSPDGREVISRPIAGRVEIRAPWGHTQNSSVFRFLEGEPDGPAEPEDEPYTDWVLRAPELGLVDVNEEAAIAKITMPHGVWISGGVYRNQGDIALEPVSFRWKTQAGSTVTQALAQRVVLRLEGLRRPRPVEVLIQGADPISLVPGASGLLQLSVTNLPVSVSDPNVSHFHLLARLSADPHVSLTEPERMSVVQTMGSDCEPPLYWRP